MKKKAKKQSNDEALKQSIIEFLGDDYQETDGVLIVELLDWLEISKKAKIDLAKSVRDDDSKKNWQALTTISMASKAMIVIFKTLGITPTDRLKQKLVDKTTTDAINNLNDFLND